MALPHYPAAKMGEQSIKQNFCAAGNPNAMVLNRDADTQEIVFAINGLSETVKGLTAKMDAAIEHRQHTVAALETRLVQAETELRFVKWFGGAFGLGTIALIIERVAGVL